MSILAQCIINDINFHVLNFIATHQLTKSPPRFTLQWWVGLISWLQPLSPVKIYMNAPACLATPMAMASYVVCLIYSFFKSLLCHFFDNVKFVLGNHYTLIFFINERFAYIYLYALFIVSFATLAFDTLRWWEMMASWKCQIPHTECLKLSQIKDNNLGSLENYFLQVRFSQLLV